MSDAALILIVVSVVTLGDIAIGLYFLRAAGNVVGTPPDPDKASPEAQRKIGRLLLISAPLIWLVVAAICFGLIPVDGIEPLTFQSE